MRKYGAQYFTVEVVWTETSRPLKRGRNITKVLGNKVNDIKYS